MKIGFISSSKMENEKRIPLHPEHFISINPKHYKNLIFEEGYPGINEIEGINFESRENIFNESDIVVLPKPVEADYALFKEGTILWGWVHCVQNYPIVQIAIEKRMTLIAWESMYKWKGNARQEHIFHRNNELAGYCAVMHAFSLIGQNPGSYGKDLRIAVIGYGATGKGTVHALLGLGANDITVFSKRSKFEIEDAITYVKYKTYQIAGSKVLMDNKEAIEILKEYDVIINCILQDTDNPVIFIKNKELNMLKKNTLIIDVSCDKGMGFEFSQPTSFIRPILRFDNVAYYAVDHTPSYLWDAASYEISGALLPYLNYMLEKETYVGSEVLEKAIEIDKGKILNPKIINFQKRSNIWPYDMLV